MMWRRLLLATLALAGGSLVVAMWPERRGDDGKRELGTEAASSAASTPMSTSAAAREEIRDGLVALTVTDEAGEPVANASVELIAVADGTRRSLRTDRAGRADVPPGTYVAWLRAAGFVGAFGPCDLRRAGTLRMEHGASVALVFVGEARGLRVRLRAEPPAEVAPTSGAVAALERDQLRKACFAEEGDAARAVELLATVAERVSFGPVAADAVSAERTCDEYGRADWKGLPAGVYRWQLLSRARVTFDPHYEVQPFTEDERGRLSTHAAPRDLSGAFELTPGATLVLAPRVEVGARVLGIVVAENGAVAGARVTLRAVARSSRTSDVAVAPEAYARTDEHGAFVFEAVPPGEKEVFAILDETAERRFRVTERALSFELAEGEERDLGLLSMAGAEVQLSARLVDTDGRPLAIEDAIAEPAPWALLTLTNGMQQAGRVGFSTTLWIRMGEDQVTTIAGLAPMVSATLSSFRVQPGAGPWTLRPGYREDLQTVSRARFDPAVQSRVVIDVPIQRVHACEFALRVPPTDLPLGTPLQGVAIRRADGRRTSFPIVEDATGVHATLELAPGLHELFVWSALPGGRACFARGRVDLPVEGRVELASETARALSGVFVDAAGAPISGALARVGFPDLPNGQWWTTARSDENGRFELPAVPLDARLVFEGASEIISAGAPDGIAVTLIGQ